MEQVQERKQLWIPLTAGLSSRKTFYPLWLIFLVVQSAFVGAFAQAPCAVRSHMQIPAEIAYQDGRFGDAENLYRVALAQKPQSVDLTAGLVRTLLQENKTSDADSAIKSIFPAESHDSVALTALAEVQFRRGQPWLALKSVNEALAINACNALSYLVRSRIMGIDSMYSSERADIQRAYDIDPKDHEIRDQWNQINAAADQLQAIQRSQVSVDALDSKSRETLQQTVRQLNSQLVEGSQTCQIVPAATTADLPLLPVLEDKKRHIYRYRLQAQIAHGQATLLVDTAASGVYISQKLATLAGLHPSAGAPPDTVHVDELTIGPLTFHDCTVGVSDTAFPDDTDGILGTDMFQAYRITLNFPAKRIALAPLPAQAPGLPGDRPMPEGLTGFTPVYRHDQYLLIPVNINKTTRRLFALGTGMTYTAMSLEVARSLSRLRVDFTNSVKTVSGAKEVFYRDHFTLEFANQSVLSHEPIAQYDLSRIDQNVGFEIAGILGMDVLDSQILQIDYRDGLVKLDVVRQPPTPSHYGVSNSMDMSGVD